MMYKIEKGIDKFLILEPYEKSTVLKTSETATVFKVIHCGSNACTLIDGLVVVAPNSVEKTMMGHQEVYYCRDSDVIAKVIDE